MIAEIDHFRGQFPHYAGLAGADENPAYFVQVSGGRITDIESDTLVFAYGHESEMDLCRSLGSFDTEVHVTGEALSPRTVEEA